MFITTLAASGSDLVRVTQPTGTLTLATVQRAASAPASMPAYDMAPLLRAPGETKPVSFKAALKPITVAPPLSATAPPMLPPSYGAAPASGGGSADSSGTTDSEQAAPVAKAGIGGLGLVLALGAALFLFSGGKRRR